MGTDTFFSTTILLLMAKLFDKKSFGSKSGITMSISKLKDSIVNQLKKFKMK